MKPVKGAQLQRGHPLAKDLLFAYAMNMGAGTALHNYAHPSKFPGVFSGSPTWSSGQKGRAVKFVSGNSDVIQVTSATGDGTAGPEFSGFVSFRATSFASNNNLMAKRETVNWSWILRVNTDGSIRFVSIGSSPATGLDFTTTAGLVSLNTDYNLIVTYSVRDNLATIYLNCVDVGSSAGAVAIRDAGDNIGIGANLVGSNHLDGLIYRSYLWNTCLCAAKADWVCREPDAMFVPRTSPARFFIPVSAAIMNQFQGPNVGADLFNGSFL